MPNSSATAPAGCSVRLRIGVPALLLPIAFGAAAAARQVSLIDAVRSADLDAAQALLQAGADANEAGADRTAALHWAVLNDDPDMTAALLDAGAEPRAANRLGVTPIHLAATNGNAAIVRRLLASGVDANTASPGGETALMTAARTGVVEVVDALLEAGADPNARESWRGQTALMWAAAENNAGAVEALVRGGAALEATSDGGEMTPFLFAVRGGHVDAAGALLASGADVDQTLPDGMSALVLALWNAHYEMAGFLLDNGADPNADLQGWTALHQIAWSRRPNAGFNMPGPPATGDLDSLELVRRLVDAGADVDRQVSAEPRDGNRNMLNRIGSTPFLMAAKSDDVPLMRVLLEMGADPSIPNEDGTTALMVAAGVGIWAPGENPGTHKEALAAVRLALDAGGGQVTDIDANGETAVHGAVYRGGAVDVIQFLAERGAPLDVVNDKGWTPLTAAEGVEYTPAVLKRYPEAAALLRRLMRDRGLDVPEPGPALSVAVTNLEGAPPRTDRDGVFTGEQAARGLRVYEQSCGSCHYANLRGDADAPPLAGPEFVERWAGSNAGNMVRVVSNQMPPDAPNSLGRQAYVDVVAYLLEANGRPAGDEEMSPNPLVLERIGLTGPTSDERPSDD